MLPFCLFRNLSCVSFRARPALCSRIRVSEMRDTQAHGPPNPTWPLSLRHSGSLLPELAIQACTHYPETARAQLLSWQALQLMTTVCVDSPAEAGNRGYEGKCCTMGMRLGCYQPWTEAVQFMVFLRHPVFQAPGSNVLLSEVPSWWRHAASTPWRAVPKTVSLNDPMHVFSSTSFFLVCFGDVSLQVLANHTYAADLSRVATCVAAQRLWYPECPREHSCLSVRGTCACGFGQRARVKDMLPFQLLIATLK